MPYYPFAVELGATYTLTNPANGAVAVFNDPSSPNYVGMITELTGLDSPEIRESSEDLIEADGGVHGAFYAGRRPIVMTARIFNHNTIAERNIRIDRAKRASLALRTDSTLSWVPSNTSGTYIEMFTTVRRQQPFRESGNWVKEIQIPLVSEYALIYSVPQRTATGTGGATIACENQGSYPANPLLRITGISAVNPTITNTTNGSTVSLLGSLQVLSGETLEIDTLTHTAKFIAGGRNGQSANRYINFGGITNWLSISPGNNNITLSGTGSLTVLWRDTWM